MSSPSQDLIDRCRAAREQGREWFAGGVPRDEMQRRFGQRYGMPATIAGHCYEMIYNEIRDDFAEFCKHPELLAGQVYREVKNDRQNPWSVRLRAQVALDDLLELPRLAQMPGGRERIPVLEAFQFYQLLLHSNGPTQAQRLRAQQRLMLLACGPPRRGRAPRSKMHAGEESLRQSFLAEMAAKQAAGQHVVPGPGPVPVAPVPAASAATAPAAPAPTVEKVPDTGAATDGEVSSSAASSQPPIAAEVSAVPERADSGSAARVERAKRRRDKIRAKKIRAKHGRRHRRSHRSPPPPAASGSAGQPCEPAAADVQTPPAQAPPATSVA